MQEAASQKGLAKHEVVCILVLGSQHAQARQVVV